MGILQQRIDLRKEEVTEQLRWLNIKMQFIQAVIDDKIKFKNQKKTQVVTQIFDVTDTDMSDDAERLLRINIMSLTDEMVKQLEKEIKEAQTGLNYWLKTTPNIQFVKDLEELNDTK